MDNDDKTIFESTFKLKARTRANSIALSVVIRNYGRVPIFIASTANL